MQDVMIDLEALSQDDPNAAIVSIGAVAFDRERQLVGDRFYVVIDLQSSLDSGGVVDGPTITWWLQQSEKARLAICAEGISLESALTRFQAWLEQQGDLDRLRVWGNGTDYDAVVLKSSYRRLGRAIPWNFRMQKCYRNRKTEAPEVPYIPTGTLHNAADDAEAQVRHLFRIDVACRVKAALVLLDERFPALADESHADGSSALSDWRADLMVQLAHATHGNELPSSGHISP